MTNEALTIVSSTGALANTLTAAKQAQVREGLGFSGNVIMVPGDYATPEMAIEASNDGDTIIIGIGSLASPASDTIYPDNLTIIGSGKPTLASDGNSLEGGTILYGPWIIGDGSTAVSYRGLKIYNLGIDCGPTVCGTYFGGIAQEGFGIASSTESGFPGFVMDNCIALCKGTTTVHAFSFEQLYDFSLSRLEGINGAHGLALKSQNGTLSDYRSMAVGTAGGSGLIFAGAATNPCRNVTATGIVVYNRTYGVTCQYASTSDSYVRDLAISTVATKDCTTGVDVQINGSGDIGPIEFANITTRGGTAGFSVQYGSTGTARKVRVNGMTSSGATTGFTPLHARLDNVTAESCTTGFQVYPTTNAVHSWRGWRALGCTTAVNVQSSAGVVSEAPSLEGNTANYGGAGTMTVLPLLFQSMQSTGAVVDTTAEVTTFLNSSVYGGSLTVPAWVVANGSLRLRVSGVYGITGTPTMIFKVYGGASAAVLLLTFPTVTLNAAGGFTLDCTFKVREPASASCIILANGTLIIDGEAHAVTGYAVLDATVAHTFAVSVQWGAASISNTIDHYMATLDTEQFILP